jgi:hypothetical protein
METGQSSPKAEELKSLHINPYTVSEHGWRGLSIPGNRKRKWYTVLQNDKVLVTALLTGIPGEYGLRHSHESGELSVHFSEALKPMVTWNPPGVLHGGIPAQQNIADAVAENLINQDEALKTDNPDLMKILEQMTQLQAQMQELQRQFFEATRPAPAPRIIIDILFPPFKTTIDDPALPGGRTVVGQWFD